MDVHYFQRYNQRENNFLYHVRNRSAIWSCYGNSKDQNS